MMTLDEARALLERYGMKPMRREHSEGVARFARTMAETIAGAHPDLALDVDRVEVAALLHDIGRTRPGPHVVNSIDILREEGHEDLACCVPHGTCYEQLLQRGIDNPALLPTTLESRIVAYADARWRLGPAPVTLEERFAEIRERRHDEPEKLRSLDMALERIRTMERQLQELMA